MSSQEYKGYTIKILQDENPYSPREDSNIGKMICFHGRYRLGDSHDYSHKDYSGWDEMEEQLKKDFRNDLILPLYLYDHGGITMNTTGFDCRWDSGQVGFIIADRDGLNECCGIKRITKNNREKILGYLEAEVETYDRYLTGDIYGFEIYNDEEELVDSCWGFYGKECCEKEAREVVDYM